jgi:two-component system, OmpR family, response regulator MprA
VTEPLICVIEDEEVIARAVAARLRAEGFAVELAHDGHDGVALVERVRPDLVVLDLMLPGMDGIEICRRLRATKVGVPIIAVTARDAVVDRVAGLEAGADDYLVKPFAVEELLARIKALLRRAHPSAEQCGVGDLVIVPSTREVQYRGEPIELTAREFDLLLCLVRHQRQVLTRQQLYELVWGCDFSATSNVLEVYVRALRRKLDRPGEPSLLHTVRGAGYTLHP